MSLLTVAINDFQSCVDLYGRPTGDRILKELAGLLVPLVGSRGCVARQGSDEFAVLLSDTNREAADVVAEKIRRAIEDQRFAVETGIPVELTVTVGVASATAPTSANALVQASQDALRRSKHEAAAG